MSLFLHYNEAVPRQNTDEWVLWVAKDLKR
jgi:hypothetical protein